MTAFVTLLPRSVGAATLFGHVTECGGRASAAGYVVQGFEEVRIGFPDLGQPCTSATQNPTMVGTATTDQAGIYSINYTPTERDPEACVFERMVFVKVFRPDGTTLIHTSAKEKGATRNAFDDVNSGTNNDCPKARFSLSFAGPSEVVGTPGATMSFEVIALLDTEFEGRQGLFGAEGWILMVAAEGGTITSATTDGTLAATVDDEPPGVRNSNGFEVTRLAEGLQGECAGLVTARSNVALAISGAAKGLPVDGPTPSILRVTIQAVAPSTGG